MAERAKIFDSANSIDYNKLSVDTFHWGRWMEEETSRRYFNRKHTGVAAQLILRQGCVPDLLPGHVGLCLPEKIAILFTSCFRRASSLL